MTNKDQITDQDVFFPTLHRQPTIAELRALCEKYPTEFSVRCSCGARALLFRHELKSRQDSPGIIGSSSVHFACPECGEHYTLGANYHLAQIRLQHLREITE